MSNCGPIPDNNLRLKLTDVFIFAFSIKFRISKPSWWINAVGEHHVNQSNVLLKRKHSIRSKGNKRFWYTGSCSRSPLKPPMRDTPTNETFSFVATTEGWWVLGLNSATHRFYFTIYCPIVFISVVFCESYATDDNFRRERHIPRIQAVPQPVGIVAPNITPVSAILLVAFFMIVSNGTWNEKSK